MIANSKPKSVVRRDSRSMSGGFGLVELMTAVAVIGILAAILFPFYSNVQDSATKRRCQRIAQEFAVVSNSAVAAGSDALMHASSVAEAMEMLLQGINGSGLFSDIKFRVAQVRLSDQTMAAHHLTLRDGALVYDPEPDEVIN